MTVNEAPARGIPAPTAEPAGAGPPPAARQSYRLRVRRAVLPDLRWLLLFPWLHRLGLAARLPAAASTSRPGSDWTTTPGCSEPVLLQRVQEHDHHRHPLDGAAAVHGTGPRPPAQLPAAGAAPSSGSRCSCPTRPASAAATRGLRASCSAATTGRQLVLHTSSDRRRRLAQRRMARPGRHLGRSSPGVGPATTR